MVIIKKKKQSLSLFSYCQLWNSFLVCSCSDKVITDGRVRVDDLNLLYCNKGFIKRQEEALNLTFMVGTRLT